MSGDVCLYVLVLLAVLCVTVHSFNTSYYEVDRDMRFRIVVKYPTERLQENNVTCLYVRGNGLGLTWDKGEELQYTVNDMWHYDVIYSKSIEGHWCETCANTTLLKGPKFQYRIYADDERDMLGPNFAIQLPVSAGSQYFETMPEYRVFPWFFTFTGTIDTLSIDSSYIGDERDLVLYLPPSYYENQYKYYQAIIVLDLDMILFFGNVFEELIHPLAATDEFILLGFTPRDDTLLDEVRLFTPSKGGFRNCINGTFRNNCDHCIPDDADDTANVEYQKNKCARPMSIGGDGDKTLNFLLFEAAPAALLQTDNRFDNASLGMIGYSLGGLLTCYAAWTRPNYVKYAACQSPSLWWPINAEYTHAYFDFVNKTLTNPLYWYDRPLQKIYIDVGGTEVGWPFYMADGAVDAARVIAEHDLFTLDENIWIHVSPDKQHRAIEYTRRIWKAMTTLFKPHGDRYPQR